MACRVVSYRVPASAEPNTLQELNSSLWSPPSLSPSLPLSLTPTPLLIPNILKIRLQIRQGPLHDHTDIHRLDIVFDGVGFPEIEPAHRAELLLGRGRVDRDGLFDDPLLVRARRRARAIHVDHRVAFDVLAGEAALGHALAAVGVDRAVVVKGRGGVGVSGIVYCVAAGVEG
jgi:hypothetical protein